MSKEEKKILFVASEANPYAGTGGLGDVIGSLPKSIAAADPQADVRVVIPLYGTIKEEYRKQMTKVDEFYVGLSWRNQYCGVYMLKNQGVTFYFLDNEYYFKRNVLYGNYDDGERYAYFCKAAMEMTARQNFIPDILHANDWQAALSVIYLKYKYPYALAEEKMNVAYHFYDSTDKVTLLFADEYTYDGADWIKTEDTETLDGPFKKVSGKWNFDPSMTLVVAPDRSAYSKSFYQACVDWVLQNKDAAYTTDNRSGSRLTDAEYYSGCAASYTNLNWRINTLPKYYWSEAGEDISAYDNWGSEDKDAMRASYQAFYDEVEKRFGEVMSAALGTLYPDVKMISGIDVIYTVQMMLYTQHIGSGTGKVTHAFEFKLVDTGKFEYVRMYALSPEYELMKDANFE